MSLEPIDMMPRSGAFSVHTARAMFHLIDEDELVADQHEDGFENCWICGGMTSWKTASRYSPEWPVPRFT